MKILKVLVFLAVIISVLTSAAFNRGVVAAETAAPSTITSAPAEIGVLVNDRVEDPTHGIDLLSSSITELSFEVTVPWEELKMETVTADGREYTQVTLPAWASTSQPGMPLLPVITEEAAVPFGADVSIQVSPGESVTRVLDAPLIPVPTQRVDWALPEDASAVIVELGAVQASPRPIHAGTVADAPRLPSQTSRRRPSAVAVIASTPPLRPHAPRPGGLGSGRTGPAKAGAAA